MKKELDIKLIEGNFNLEDGNMLLLELLRYKINFHDRRIFSDFVRAEADTHNSQQRIEQLNLSLAELRQYIAESKETGQRLDIQCTIHIRKE